MRSGGGDSYGTPRAVILINNQTNWMKRLNDLLFINFDITIIKL